MTELHRIVKLRYGNTNTFCIIGRKGNLLIDTDYAGTLGLFFKEIKEAGIDLKNIDYVLATHYHPDHMGLVGELQELGIRLVIIDVQINQLHFSDEIFMRERRFERKHSDSSVLQGTEGRGHMLRSQQPPALRNDIKNGFKAVDEGAARISSLNESRSFLNELGIDGEIIHTPSHSEDSISLILDSGGCFVGDLEPYSYVDAYADNQTLKSDWEKVMSHKPSKIFYAHANEVKIK